MSEITRKLNSEDPHIIYDDMDHFTLTIHADYIELCYDDGTGGVIQCHHIETELFESFIEEVKSKIL